MIKAVLLVLLFFVLNTVYGQDKKQSIYKTQVVTHQGVKADGVLTLLGDSTIHLAPLSQLNKDVLVANPIVLRYAVKDVYALRFSKKGAAGKGAIIGGGAGILIGSIIGYMTYSSSSFQVFDKTDAGIIGGVMGASFGAGLGALAGGTSSKITLYGDPETYNQQRNKLEPLVLKVSVQY